MLTHWSYVFLALNHRYHNICYKCLKRVQYALYYVHKFLSYHRRTLLRTCHKSYFIKVDEVNLKCGTVPKHTEYIGLQFYVCRNVCQWFIEEYIDYIIPPAYIFLLQFSLLSQQVQFQSFGIMRHLTLVANSFPSGWQVTLAPTCSALSIYHSYLSFYNSRGVIYMVPLRYIIPSKQNCSCSLRSRGQFLYYIYACHTTLSTWYNRWLSALIPFPSA